MSEVKKNAAEAQNASETKIVETFNAKVLRVILPQGNDQRITLVTNTNFKSIDFTSQEEVIKNRFGLDQFALVNQVRELVPDIQLAETLAMGQMVNPQIIALALTNADITFKREFKSADELRENGEETYGRDLYKTTITKVVCHILPNFKAAIDKLTMEKPAVVRQTTSIDFFNI